MDDNNNNNNDQIILVDELDRPLTPAPKLQVHQQGRLHRAFSVFLWREGQLLLQQRAAGKYHSGGLWANTCCSHPRWGEEVAAAAQRRLLEECGISGVVLRPLFRFRYRVEFANGLCEHELDHVLWGYYPAEDWRPDDREIAQLRWWDWRELERELAENPQNFAVWFQICAPRVIDLLR